LVEPILLKTRFNWVEVFLGLMVMAGIYLIFHFDPQYKLGILLGLICALLMAFVMIFIRQMVQRINPETVLTYQISGGFVTLTILMPLYFYFVPTQKFLPNLEDIGWLLILAWLCSVLAFQLSVYALKRLSAFTVNLNFNLEPVYGIILAFVFFNENKKLSSGFYLGLTLIALSLIIHVLMVLQGRTKKEKRKWN
jgi:drug/metabolite transporter (DMT)-like permease